ncbi:MAG: hypothetical protein ACI8ZM_002988 [Crocinitomix sp.]|jgi:hypothetical protein
MNGLYHTGATELHDIFLAPLKAVIDAEMSLAESIKRFIWETGFTPKGEVRTVHFNYELQGEVQTLNIPVLSIITLPLLGIKDAEFDMHVKMMTIAESHEEPVQLPSLTGKEAKPTKPKVGLKGFLTPHNNNISESTSLKTNMRVKLHMGESAMPGGIIKILALLNNNLIADKNSENEQSK